MEIFKLDQFNVSLGKTTKELYARINRSLPYEAGDSRCVFRSIFAGSMILTKIIQECDPFFPFNCKDEGQALVGLWKNISVFKNSAIDPNEIIVFYSGNYGFEGSRAKSFF
jgi:hypothetical protein